MNLQSSCLIYSLWPGYLERDRTDLREWAKRKEIDFHIVHSSGHASSADLHRMAQAVAPQRLLPIHTVHPERYASLSANTEIVANGAWVTPELALAKHLMSDNELRELAHACEVARCCA